MSKDFIPLEPSFSQPFTESLGLTSGITSLATSTTFLYGASIMIIVVVSGLMYAHAGVLRMGASTNSISKSNAEIKRVTLGLLGVLSLFLIISAVNRDLLTGDVNLDELGTGSVVRSAGVGNTGGGVGTTPANKTPSTGNGSGDNNLRALNNVGISINHNNVPCTEEQMNQSKPNCTSLEGLQNNTINMLLQLRLSCPSCKITITGGTEPGHSINGNHKKGGRAVDISLDGTLLAFLKQQGTSVGSDKWLWGGYTFWNESAGATANTTGAHFHVD